MCNISFRSYFSSQNQKIKHTTFICSTPLPNMFITLHLINILHIQNNNNVTTCVGQFFSAIFMMVKQVWHFQDQKRGGGIYQLRGVAIWAEENPMHHQNTCKRIIPFSFTHKASSKRSPNQFWSWIFSSSSCIHFYSANVGSFFCDVLSSVWPRQVNMHWCWVVNQGHLQTSVRKFDFDGHSMHKWIMACLATCAWKYGK